jgi:hypothetical protein
MEHVDRHGILPKGLLTPGNVLSAILIGGIVVLLAGQSAYTQAGQEANKVLVGAAAFGDWHNDAPGVRWLITSQDLPEIAKEEPSFAEVVPMPVGETPRVPEGFSAELEDPEIQGIMASVKGKEVRSGALNSSTPFTAKTYEAGRQVGHSIRHLLNQQRECSRGLALRLQLSLNYLSNYLLKFRHCRPSRSSSSSASLGPQVPAA